MRLSTIIELYAGGPGSGCNPEVGKCGRPAGNSDVHQFIESYKQMYQPTTEHFKSVVGNLGAVEARVKTESSLQEKLGRKNISLSNVKDALGMRVTVNSMDDLSKAVAQIKANYKILEEENKIANPTNGIYRAYHFTADVNGKPVEIQVRTVNQSRLAIWMHDTIYKGALKSSDTAVSYAKKLSDYLFQVDMGKPIGKMPDCPPILLHNCFSESLPFTEHII